tara:strand:- start:142 stop:549 length:408 start_codon:yes stop_codon:yes gene_type:complete
LIKYADYRCAKGHLHIDAEFEKEIPRNIPCHCGSTADRLPAFIRIHNTNSGAGYGKFDPQFGCVVESSQHRRDMMKKMGMEDMGGTVRGVPEWQIEHEPVKKSDGPSALVADSLEDLSSQLADTGHDIDFSQMKE